MTDDALLPLPDGDEPDDGRGQRIVCGMCGAELRDRVSRMWGLGRDCRLKAALRVAPVPPRVDVEQDVLPGL